MTDERLTDLVAEHVMGWKSTPDRFIKSGRSWLPKWRFRPLSELTDAFRLLDHAAEHYTLTRNRSLLTADVQIASCRGTATGEYLARTITLAVAQALQLEVGE